MKQKAISLSLSFFIHKNSKKKGALFRAESSLSRDDGMERVRKRRDALCSSHEFMSREEFSGKQRILLQSFITHFQGSSSLPSFIFISSICLLFIFSSSTPSVTVLLKLNEHVCTHFFFQLYHCFITNYLSFVTVSSCGGTFKMDQLYEKNTKNKYTKTPVLCKALP